jgi:NAD(P)-dependent dehydrogenase (short-subunit alcohol dehydrogenase family)
MTQSCAGRRALVTGASRGIGVGIAQRLVGEGARVAVTARSLKPEDHHLAGSLEETVALLRDMGGEAFAIVGDLADPAVDKTQIVREAEAALGGTIEILVNNAAAAFYIPFEEMSEKRFRIGVELNIRSPWALMQAVLPGMRAAGEGWILNISSATSRIPKGPPFKLPAQTLGATIYGGTKAMLERFSVGVAGEVYGTGIAVNTLAPEAGVLTPGADALVDMHSGDILEPMETMAEAALALVTGDPMVLTGRIAYSLTLIKELGRPVFTLDGKELVPGWQPDEIPEHRLIANRP